VSTNDIDARASGMRAVPALPIFEGLDQTTAARLVAAFSWRTYERGDRIGWAERADARTVVMVSGAARLVRMGPDRRLIGVGLLEAGAVFGRVPFATEAPTERAEALSAVRVLGATTAEVERIALTSPRLVANLLSDTTERLSRSGDRLAQLAFQSVPARLAETLIELGERFGRMTARGVRIDLRITHGQLAETISTTRETLTKAAGWLRSEEIAVLGRQEIWILDQEGLADVAGGVRVMPGRGNGSLRVA
jgi:CRP/FNR family cyclic AMP-dependent transcriptional regulator